MEFKRAPMGPEVQIRKRPDDPKGAQGVKMVKNVVLYALFQGSRRGPWAAESRVALPSR